MDEKLIVSSSPHILDDDTTQRIMLDVVIALLPATIAAVYYFRTNAAMIILLSVLTAVITEAGMQKWMGRPITIKDFSAVVTGLLLALNIPASSAWWMPIIGSFFAIAIVKQIFGGVGHNFMNPALAGRIFLTLSWTNRMTDWISPGVDAVSTATPLALLKEAGGTLPTNLPPIVNTIIGNTAGSMGETSALLLILGGGYLVYKGVISWKIPSIYIGTVGILTLIYGGFDFTYMLYHVFSGGLMIGAIYMATDYASSPVTARGRIYFAIGCGILTSLIRIFGAYPEGVAFSILLMNVASPLIDRFTSPRVFGEVK